MVSVAKSRFSVECDKVVNSTLNIIPKVQREQFLRILSL